MTKNQKSLININRASADELVTIHGIGASLAERIIEHRPYQALTELVKVSGINENKLASLLPFITTGQRSAQTARSEIITPTEKQNGMKPITKIGETEAFVFLGTQNEKQDALLIILGGFIFGLLLLILRRSNN